MAGKLVLQIKEKEWFLIGSDIIVTVERVRGCHVKVSVSAPEEIKILRGTLIEKDQRNVG